MVLTMKLNKKSQWQEDQITAFLETAGFPIRLSFLNQANEPKICSLWFQYSDGAIWSASHKNSFLIKQLQNNQTVAFEVSTNEYPYKGVRGTAEVALSMSNADKVLDSLIKKYLGNGNSSLATWLMSRSDDEFVIKMTPTKVNAWDFSDRMQSNAS